MKGFLCLVLSIWVIWKGLDSGSAIDMQERHLPLKDVYISPKWRKFFRFRWDFRKKVLLVAVIMETASLCTGVLLGVWGILLLIDPAATWCLTAAKTTFVAYGSLLLICCIYIRIVEKKYNKQRKRFKCCWCCEIESWGRFLSSVERTATIVSSYEDEKWGKIYRIKLNGFIPREFEAVKLSHGKKGPTPQAGEEWRVSYGYIEDFLYSPCFYLMKRTEGKKLSGEEACQ